MNQNDIRILSAVAFPVGVPLALSFVWRYLTPFPSLWAACLTLAAVACVLGLASGWMLGRLGLSVLVTTPVLLAMLGYVSRFPALHGGEASDIVNQLFPFIYVLSSALPVLLAAVVLGGFLRSRKGRGE